MQLTMAPERRRQLELTAERLKEVLQYFPTTGRFRWRVRHGFKRPNEEAGTMCRDGYRRIQIDGVIHYAHRLAWLYVHGEHPTGEIDHRNGNPSDNRIANLRHCPHGENVWHALKRKMTGTTGVFLYRGRWQTTIRVAGRRYHLGIYDTKEEAAAAYKCGARLLRSRRAPPY